MTARPGTPAGDDLPSTAEFGAIRDGDVLTVMVSGDLDATCGTSLDAVLTEALAGDPPGHVAIDLSNVDFCDSAGVRALVQAHRLATGRGTRCRMIRPQPHVGWLLRTIGAEETLNLQA